MGIAILLYCVGGTVQRIWINKQEGVAQGYIVNTLQFNYVGCLTACTSTY